MTPLTTEKMAVAAPTPRPSVTTARTREAGRAREDAQAVLQVEEERRHGHINDGNTAAPARFAGRAALACRASKLLALNHRRFIPGLSIVEMNG